MRHDGAITALGRTLVCFALCLTVSGCRHRQAAATLPAVLQAPDVQPPAPDSPTMQTPPPASIATAPQITVVQAKPKRAPKKTPPKTTAADGPVSPGTTPPTEGGNSAPIAEASIGALSAGGDASMQAQQDAAELIGSCEQRLKEASQNTKGQKSSLRKVQLFIKQAKQALGTGDAAGAMTLATKAKLLLDDLAKEP